MTTHFSCPVEVTLSLIGGKWKPGILWQLHDGPRHFSDLERSLPGITHKVLTSQLRQLERDGIVSRVDSAYTLSPFGQTLRPALDELAGWGKRNVARYGGLLSLVVAAFLLTGSLSAQEASTTDHAVVIEIGGAGEWPLQGEQPNYGATLAAETTPIEHWLEVEAGATILGTNRHREIAADFIVKKPFEISSTVELMAGVGPELTWSLTRGSSARSVATECALDLMIWPTRNVGWYLEPTYDLTSFRPSGRSLALAAGLIVGLPWLR